MLSINLNSRIINPAPESPDFCSPYLLGKMDAEDGEPCIPESYYVWTNQMHDYARGYASVAGQTLTTRQVLGELEATIDYEDNMLDREFWASGNW